MTVKERWTAAMHLQPVDRLSFWPKLEQSYVNRWGRSVQEWYNEFGNEHPGGVGPTFREVRKKTGYKLISDGHVKTHIYQTPYGDLKQIERYDAVSNSWHPVEHPIHTKADIETMTAWFADDAIEFDREALERAKTRYAEIGQSANVSGHIGHSALQQFVERLAGIERAHYFIADYPETVNEFVSVYHEFNLKRIKNEAEHSPADTLVLVENTSTTTISPSQYETLCFDHVKEYCSIAKAGGKDTQLHMCGHLKRLLPFLSKLGATSFEAFTTPTVGDTTLLDGRTACPDVCLIGGTNAYIWLFPANKIIEIIEKELDALPHHRGIIISSGGVMPQGCAPETIKTVRNWIYGYKLKF